jgi:hypothetical protein
MLNIRKSYLGAVAYSCEIDGLDLLMQISADSSHYRIYFSAHHEQVNLALANVSDVELFSNVFKEQKSSLLKWIDAVKKAESTEKLDNFPTLKYAHQYVSARVALESRIVKDMSEYPDEFKVGKLVYKKVPYLIEYRNPAGHSEISFRHGGKVIYKYQHKTVSLEYALPLDLDELAAKLNMLMFGTEVSARVALESEITITIEDLLNNNIKSFKIGNITFTKREIDVEDSDENVYYNFVFGSPKVKLNLSVAQTGYVFVSSYPLFKKVGEYELDEPIKNVFNDVKGELQSVINGWNHYLKTTGKSTTARVALEQPELTVGKLKTERVKSFKVDDIVFNIFGSKRLEKTYKAKIDDTTELTLRLSTPPHARDNKITAIRLSAVKGRRVSGGPWVYYKDAALVRDVITKIMKDDEEA